MALTELDCRKLLSDYNNNSVFSHFLLKPFDEKVLGFMGDHHCLKITFEEDEKQKISTFFLKVIPKASGVHINYVKEIGIFEKEARLYLNVIPKLQQYSAEPFAPKALLINQEEFIILEDLKMKGYTTFDSPLTEDHCKSLLRCLARFHSSSIIFEERRGIKGYKIIDEYPLEFQETSFSFQKDHPRYKWCANATKAILDCLKMMPECSNVDVSNKMKIFLENGLRDYIEPSKKYRNSITHCDLWRNNMMFKKTNHLECILVDFQFARYIPPVYDVLLTLYLNISYDILEEKLDVFLEYYYDNLKKCLQMFKISIEDILPVADFWSSVEFYKPLAGLEAALFGTIAFVEGELSTKIMTDGKVFEEFFFFDRSKYICPHFQANEKYRKQLGDSLRILVNLFK